MIWSVCTKIGEMETLSIKSVENAIKIVPRNPSNRYESRMLMMRLLCGGFVKNSKNEAERKKYKKYKKNDVADCVNWSGHKIVNCND
jgi:hypothetical protein